MHKYQLRIITCLIMYEHNMKIYVCLILIAYVARTEATCPEVKPVDNFNVTAFFSGVWHDIARYANHFETAEGCISAKYSKDGDVLRIDSIDVAEDEHHFIAATGKQDADGKISFTVATGYPRQVVDVNSLTVMLVDYEKYAVIYDCIHENNDTRESFWIVSRKKYLKDEDKETVLNFLKSSNVIDVNRLMWLDNSDEKCKQ